MRSPRSQRLLAIAATAYGTNAQASPMGTSIKSCDVNWALPNACTTEQGSVNVNTIFDTTSPGRFPNEPDRPAKYPAMIIATNAATLIRTPSTTPPPQCRKRAIAPDNQKGAGRSQRLISCYGASLIPGAPSCRSTSSEGTEQAPRP